MNTIPNLENKQANIKTANFGTLSQVLLSCHLIDP